MRTKAIKVTKETKAVKATKGMKPFSLKLPPQLDDELAVLARRRSVGKSALVREAIERYLASRPAKRSFLSLAGNLAGCVEGPSDLATGAEHLEGYGD